MKFRLKPTPTQETDMLLQCAQARYVWNLGLEQRNMWKRHLGPTPMFVGQSAQLTEARKAESWLAGGSQTVQQQALRDLDQAFCNWWSNPSHFGRPTWRRHGVHEGFRIVGPQAKRWERLSSKRAQINIPKVGWVNFRWSRHPGEPKSYRVTCDSAGRWWIAFAVIPKQINAPGTGAVVGIDRGVTHAFVTSEGDMIDVQRLKPSEKAHLLRLQRKSARQQNGSESRERTKRSIAKIKHREINRRKDVIEKLTTDLARTFDIVRIEDLKIKNMVRSAKGTSDKPGANVSQKAGLNREILASGWGLFGKRLKEKIGDRLELVPAAYTSQRCNACGHVARENRESQAVFRCVVCKHSANADVNAAKNIAAGWAATASGGSRLGPLKLEPLLV